MFISAWVFVFLVFAALGASFLAATVTLWWEFKDAWLDFAALDSHLFIFFPTLGLVALVAFYIPSVLFTDLYWRHIRFGKTRFFVGALVVAAASYWVAGVLLDNPRRSYWEGAPQVVTADAGEPAGCAQRGEPCERLPMLLAVHNLREVSRNRLGLDALIRNCGTGHKDALVERVQTLEKRRFCLASTPLSAAPALQGDPECCKAQSLLAAAARANYINGATRSLTSEVHAILLPLKVFFLLVVFTISILLALHHRKVEQHYKAYLPQMEIGLFVGALCILFFPIMSEAFLHTSDVLNGTAGRGTFSATVPVISLLSMIWVLLIGLFFYRRNSEGKLVTVGRIAGMLASNIGIIKYNLVVTIFVLAFGAGASELGLIGPGGVLRLRRRGVAGGHALFPAARGGLAVIRRRPAVSARPVKSYTTRTVRGSPLTLSLSRASSPWRACHLECRIRKRMRMGEGTPSQRAQPTPSPLAGEGWGEGAL